MYIYSLLKIHVREFDEKFVILLYSKSINTFYFNRYFNNFPISRRKNKVKVNYKSINKSIYK